MITKKVPVACHAGKLRAQLYVSRVLRQLKMSKPTN
jgi:hypothetical protein